MKKSVKSSESPVRSGVLAALLALWAAGATAAGAPSSPGLQDPTRPPAAAAPPQAGAGEAPAGPQLQSVLLAPAAGSARIAVIDGESVRVGESFRGARVVRIADNEVELLRGRERQVLRLYAPEAGSGKGKGMTRVAAPAQRREQGEP